MKCEIIRDLLPLYIENLCSERELQGGGGPSCILRPVQGGIPEYDG